MSAVTSTRQRAVFATIDARTRHQLARVAVVPCGPLREQVLALLERTGWRWGDVARLAGLTRPVKTAGGRTYITGDGSRLRRLLGVDDYPGAVRSRTVLPYEMAERICVGLGLDPHDCGV